MDDNQLQQVSTLVEDFFSLDLNSLLANTYDPKVGTENHQVGKYNLTQYKSLLRRVFEHFRDELKGETVKRLPFQYNFHNEYGNGNLQQDISQLVNHLKSNHFPQSIQNLDRLITYQSQNGFWERSKRKYHKASEVELKDAKDKIETTLLAAEKLQKDYELAIQRVNEFLTSSEEKINRYNAQIEEINSLLENSRHRSDEITSMQSEASVLLEKISGSQNQSSEILEKHKEIANQSQEILDNSEKLLGSIKSEQNNLSEKFKELLQSIDNKEEFINSKNDFFTERVNYLNDLIGSEVGASLFNTFKTRKDELNSGVTFWTWGVGITALLTVIWIVFLFYNVKIDELTVGSWLATTLKSIPAILILFFAISQYSRERSYQEEYAFKSAVALTLKAYADQLHSDENHDDLIINAVAEVFRSPQITHKASKSDNDETAREALKNMTDLSKSAINKIRPSE